ncbi:MAG: acyl-CoA dehydrogenase [Desulfosarcinaceae bacterium]|nr:acyl-CoA dehydrogenase [Desulfosarcinaceae bacterium]
MTLFNPRTESFATLDERSRAIMQKTIAFFENKGKAEMKAEDHERRWYTDYLDFLKAERVFATLLTPSAYGDADCRWDTHRNCAFNEITAFYSLAHWYAWQVSILGLGPIWMGSNEAVKHKTAKLLEEGAIFAFGLSEKAHGADLYASEMTLTDLGEGRYVADGGKYYIGNGNAAAYVSTFAKESETGEYIWFVAESDHPNYECVQNLVNSQMYVSEYALNGYPLSDGEILSRGPAAWDSALNTINVGKYNLGWASIGISTHAFYEAINHAAKRSLYGRHVTDFPHIRQLFVDAFTRLAAMRMFAYRAADYMRIASPEDRRYLLYNPMVKMKVTTQGEAVVNLLWDVIAARGFEKDTYFEAAARDIRALPKLEGTVHVNMALIVKFMANYFFYPGQFPNIGHATEAVNDDFLFAQGPTRGLGKIQFHDFRIAYASLDLPNLAVFREQIAVLEQLLLNAAPDTHQQKDIDFLLALGEMFTLVAYGQLLIEKAAMDAVDADLLDQMFDFMVRDFSGYALQLLSKPSSSQAQIDLCRQMIRKPVVDGQRFERVWRKHVFSQVDAYEMNP